MTERGKRNLEEILRKRAGEVVSGSADPWPAVRERVVRRFGEGSFTGPSLKATAVLSHRWPRRIVPRTRVGWVVAALIVTLFGTAAYAASGMTVSDLTVEEAVLQNVPGGDQIVVRVSATGSADLPWCYLTQGRSLQDSQWFDDDLTESVNLGDETIFTFYEDTDPSGKPVDPARTPFFVACSAGTSPGGDGPGVRYDDAHVEGTAGGKAPWPSESREFVRKDMEYRQITPPVSTLSSGSKSVEGEFGTYCWSPGQKDNDEDALWCWDEQEHGGVPGRDKTLHVTPGSTLLFDFGGEVQPNYADAGAFPLSFGRLTGRAATDLRMESNGRIQVPGDIPAGEYATSVFVSGPQGEADYSFRIAVEREQGERP